MGKFYFSLLCRISTRSDPNSRIPAFSFIGILANLAVPRALIITTENKNSIYVALKWLRRKMTEVVYIENKINWVCIYFNNEIGR